MKTAVDTSVLLDVLSGLPPFAQPSARALKTAYAEGMLVACDVVWAETRAHFSSDADLRDAMKMAQVQFQPVSHEAAELAGDLWSLYRRQGGSRKRVTADFLVGAHALLQADRLLARDRGFYRPYFKRLKLIDPARI